MVSAKMDFLNVSMYTIMYTTMYTHRVVPFFRLFRSNAKFGLQNYL